MQKIISCKVTDEYVQGTGAVVGAAGSHDDAALELSFSEIWNGTTKRIVWFDALGQNPTLTILTPQLLVPGEEEVYRVPIPAEAKAVAGNLMMSIRGVVVGDGGYEDKAVVSATAEFVVLESVWDNDASESEEITPSQAEQLQAELDSIKTDISATVEAAKKLEEYVDITDKNAKAAALAEENAKDAQAAAAASATASSNAASLAGTNAANAAKSAAEAKQAATDANGVLTFNGRKGSVVPQKGDYSAEMVTGAVPETRKINGKPLTSDITLTAEEMAGAVPITRKVNGKALSSDITLSAADVGAELAGLVHKKYYISGEDDDFLATINSVYESMPDASVRYIQIGFSTQHPVIGGANRLIRIYRVTSIYGALEAFSYIGGAGADVYYRSFINGEWKGFAQDINTGNIGTYAAPAGFGLGIRQNTVVVSSIDEIINITASGWYSLVGSQTLILEGIAFNVCGLTVDMIDAEYCIQTINFFNRISISRQVYYQGTATPWEWINPPMELGVEYRTTERSEGKPVYAKRLSYTPASNIGSGTATNILHGISNFGDIVRTSGRVVNLTIPYLGLNGAYAGIRAVDKTNIEFCSNGFGWNSGYPGLFDLYYTKTTD